MNSYEIVSLGKKEYEIRWETNFWKAYVVSDYENWPNNSLVNTPFECIKIFETQKYGLVIDKTQLLLEPRYSRIIYFRSHRVILALDEKGPLDSPFNYYYYDINGNCLLEEKASTDPFIRHHLAIPKIAVTDTLEVVYINCYDKFNLDRNDYRIISWQYYIIRREGCYGIVDYNNTELLPAKYKKLFTDENVDNVIAEDETGYYSIDVKNKQLEKIEYDHVLVGEEVVYGFHGFIVKNGEYLKVLKKGSSVKHDHNPLPTLFGKYEGEWGIISIDGKEIIEPMFRYISKTIERKYFLILGEYEEESEGDGVFEEFEQNFQTYSHDGDSLDFYMKNQKWGIIDVRGKLIIPVEYQFITFVNDHWLVNKGCTLFSVYYGDHNKRILETLRGKWGALEVNGNIIIPIEYNKLLCFNDISHLLLAENHLCNWGALDWENKIVLPFEYTTMGDLYNFIIKNNA